MGGHGTGGGVAGDIELVLAIPAQGNAKWVAIPLELASGLTGANLRRWLDAGCL